jgi:hypothetical protein
MVIPRVKKRRRLPRQQAKSTLLYACLPEFHFPSARAVRIFSLLSANYLEHKWHMSFLNYINKTGRVSNFQFIVLPLQYVNLFSYLAAIIKINVTEFWQGLKFTTSL